MPADPILGGLFIFMMRLTDMSLDTIRIVMVMRGKKLFAGLIGFVEVTIFILAISQVVSNVGNVWNVLGYSGGFAAGTMLGMFIEERLAMGYSTVRIMSKQDGTLIAQKIRQAGFGATEVVGWGRENLVGIVEAVMRRKDVPTAVALATAVDAEAFITIEETRAVRRGFMRLGK